LGDIHIHIPALYLSATIQKANFHLETNKRMSEIEN